jgi:hypothetical protein
MYNRREISASSNYDQSGGGRRRCSRWTAPSPSWTCLTTRCGASRSGVACARACATVCLATSTPATTVRQAFPSFAVHFG